MTDGSEPEAGPDTAPMPASPPRAWVIAGRYRVIERIGSGGMAEVFRARDELLNRDVAVKVFRAPVEEPGNARSIARRELELKALAQLSHPNLITLFDGSISDAGTSFLVMELVVGQDLAVRLRDGPLPEAQVRAVGAQIADALAFVHARGMVHRDVKPANILLGKDDAETDPGAIRARLSDFGIVRMVDNARLTAVAFTLGTASYLAPEQAVGANVDAAADVYSLGLVLIEALTGVRSFDGPQHEAVAARLHRSPDIPAGLPAPWPGLLAAMTAADPAARPSAAEVAASLRSNVLPAGDQTTRVVGTAIPVAVASALGADQTQSFAPVPLQDPSPQPTRRRAWPLLISAVAVLAIVVAAGFLLLRLDSHPGSPGGTTSPAGSHTRSGATNTGSGSRSVATTSTAAAPSTRASSSRPVSTAASSATSSSAPPSSSSAAASTSTAASASTSVFSSAPLSSSSSAPSTTAALSAATSTSAKVPRPARASHRR